jgi:ubiquinone/menaquinone biosynthesis C-methylase UbiE
MYMDSTRAYYETNAEEYFRATYSQSLWPLWEKLGARLEPGSSILDLGCGSGRDARYFASQDFQVIGIDISFNLLKLAKQFSHQPFAQADFFSLPFRESSFDAVWAIGSLLHAPRQLLPFVLAEVHRVLKPGGIFLASIKKGGSEAVDARGRYFAYYQLSEWQHILAENGYGEVEVEEMSEFRKNASGEEIEIVWLVSLAKATTRKVVTDSNEMAPSYLGNRA